jgi:hypothetical protein
MAKTSTHAAPRLTSARVRMARLSPVSVLTCARQNTRVDESAGTFPTTASKRICHDCHIPISGGGKGRVTVRVHATQSSCFIFEQPAALIKCMCCSSHACGRLRQPTYPSVEVATLLPLSQRGWSRAKTEARPAPRLLSRPFDAVWLRGAALPSVGRLRCFPGGHFLRARRGLASHQHLRALTCPWGEAS